MIDWNESTWGELIELKYGKSLRDYRDCDGDFPVFGTNGQIGWWTEPLCDHPSIVIGRKGAYRGVHYADRPFFVIDTAFFVEPLKDINLKWAYFHLLLQDINSLDSGSAIPSTRREDVYRLPVTVPPRAIQDEIADILSSFEYKVELNRQINQTLEQIAQAIFKSWFVDFEPVKAKQHIHALGGNDEQTERAAQAVISSAVNLDDITTATDLSALDKQLTDALSKKLAHQTAAQREKLAATASHFPDEFVDSETGLLPEGWMVSSVGEEFALVMGQSPPGNSYNEDGAGVPFFQGRRDFGWRYPSNRVYCTEPKRLASKGDTLLSVRAPVGDVNIAITDCCIGRGLAALRHRSGCESFTYYSVLNLSNVLDSFGSEGTVFGSINQKDLRALRFVAPSEVILATFSSFASSLDSQILNLEKQKRSLRETRDILLPRLLSGELRVAGGA